MLPIVMIAGYLLGGPAAIFGGLVVAIISPWIPFRPLRVACAAVIGGVAAIIFQLDVHPDAGIPNTTLATAGAAAAAICSSIVELVDRRRMQRRTAS